VACDGSINLRMRFTSDPPFAANSGFKREGCRNSNAASARA
jgi:hypothetical protein